MKKTTVSYIETRRRLIFSPCCSSFTFLLCRRRRRLLEAQKNEGFNFQFIFSAPQLHTSSYLHASLAEATPNDNPFVFSLSLSFVVVTSKHVLRIWLCFLNALFFFFFLSRCVSFPLTIQLSLSSPLCRKELVVHIAARKRERCSNVDCSSAGRGNECVCLTFRVISYL